jgi:hypothetical protein
VAGFVVAGFGGLILRSVVCDGQFEDVVLMMTIYILFADDIKLMSTDRSVGESLAVSHTLSVVVGFVCMFFGNCCVVLFLL